MAKPKTKPEALEQEQAKQTHSIPSMRADPLELPTEPAAQAPAAEQAPAPEPAAEQVPAPEPAADGIPETQEDSPVADAPAAPAPVPLSVRIKEALGTVDRMDRTLLCKQLKVPILDFDEVVGKLIESKEIKEDGKSLYLPLSPEERLEYQALLAASKRDSQIEAIRRIVEERKYREDYPNLNAFLETEYGMNERKYERRKVKKKIDAMMLDKGIKFPRATNQSMTDTLNTVDHDADLFVAVVSEYIKGKQTGKRLKEIAAKHKAEFERLAALRKTVPDVRTLEIADLDKLKGKTRQYIDKQGWEEIGNVGVKAYLQDKQFVPQDTALLKVARGSDLTALVTWLLESSKVWEDRKAWDQRKAELEKERKALEREGIRKGFDKTAPKPDEPKPDEPKPDDKPEPDADEDKPDEDKPDRIGSLQIGDDATARAESEVFRSVSAVDRLRKLLVCGRWDAGAKDALARGVAVLVLPELGGCRE